MARVTRESLSEMAGELDEASSAVFCGRAGTSDAEVLDRAADLLEEAADYIDELEAAFRR
jgi:hypothetical protein